MVSENSFILAEHAWWLCQTTALIMSEQ
jgi:hypothetical protein